MGSHCLSLVLRAVGPTWCSTWATSPPAIIFRRSTTRSPDPAYPLQMWLCSTCGLAQLVGEPIVAEEPLGAEPEALVAQAVDAVERLAATGWLSGRSRVVEFASPHGGSWLGLLVDRGVAPVADDGRADLVIDSFGMMHDPDQATALAERIARVAPGGVLLLQYHSLDTIIRLGQWNALRHGHFAYYSTSALVGMLEANGFSPRMAWRFELYGGTILLAACRESGPRVTLDGSVTALLSDRHPPGVRDPVAVGRLQDQAGGPRPGTARLARRRSRTAMEEASSGTAPPRVRSRSCAEPGWTDGSCLRSLTRRRQSMGFACQGRTFPSSARPTLATLWSARRSPVRT